MTNVTDLRSEQIRRATDAMKITEAELLRDLASRIESGELRPAGVTVVLVNKTAEGGEEVRVHRAQMDILQEAGVLTIAQIDSARVLTS